MVLKQFQSKLTMVIYNYLMSKPGSDNLRVLDKLTKFVQIRVKSIEFQNEQAIAVYFYEMTKHVLSIKHAK